MGGGVGVWASQKKRNQDRNCKQGHGQASACKMIGKMHLVVLGLTTCNLTTQGYLKCYQNETIF
jgi:hypothetical protein